jgi:hypothetical protein
MAGGVTQGVGPEFKPSTAKKKKSHFTKGILLMILYKMVLFYLTSL